MAVSWRCRASIFVLFWLYFGCICVFFVIFWWYRGDKPASENRSEKTKKIRNSEKR